MLPSQVYNTTPSPGPTPIPTPLPTICIEQGDWALFIGDYDLALQEYQTAFNSNPEPEIQAAALVGIGRAQILLGDYNSAVQSLIEVTENYPESYNLANAYFFLGQCYTDQESPHMAADAYAKYLQLRPGILDAYVQELRGDVLAAGGSHQAAISAYETAILAPRLSDSTNLEIKIGQMYSAMDDHNNAIRQFISIYDTTNNDYIKAQMNYLVGQEYIALELPEQAHARFQDSVNNYPLSYDSYLGLVALIEDDVPVDDLNRGIVDYYARQYGVALDAFIRYQKNTPDHDGTVLHYKALTLRASSEPESAIAEWDELITNHSGDRFWNDAWDEKAYTQWVYLDQYSQASQTLLDFVNLNPDTSEAPSFLYEAARILERNNQLEEAATIWERLINEYPSHELSYRGLFLAGISYFRLGDFVKAQTTFQRSLVLGITPSDQAAAYFWIGKTQQAQNDHEAAYSSWEQASQRDPTGYYSERARELLIGESPFSANPNFDLDCDLNHERNLAENWMRSIFNIPPETDLSDLGPLADDSHVRRGNTFWELGLYPEASAEFEYVRKQILEDPVNNFRLLNHLLKLGLYRPAIFTSRQILNNANLDDARTFTAPDYFNHIRFGSYFKEMIIAAAERETFHPLFLLSIIRQESMFEGFVQSSADARGLMQIIPATGQEIASEYGWPPNYTDEDLFRPLVSITLGAHYLARQRDYFDGDLYLALAGYNGGPGNTLIWSELAPNDPDLFLEVIRFNETQQYIKYIAEIMRIYRRLYAGNK